jgi:Ca-activated chloride channel homolog
MEEMGMKSQTGWSVRNIVAVLVLLSIMAAGAAWAAKKKPAKKEAEKEKPYLKAPADGAGPNQMPEQVQTNARGDKRESVTPIPLDGLRAKKITTKDGKSGWKVTIPGGRALATPAVVDGMVYVGGGFGSYEFYAFDAGSGEPRWAIKVSDDGPTAAVAAEGVVAFNTESCTLFVVDGKTGKMLWGKWLGDPLMSQPAIADGKVFMAFPGEGGHYLIALGLKDGKEQWRKRLAGDIISAPVAYKDSVYLTTFDGTVYRFKMSDGTEEWKKDYNATSAPWLYQDQVYASKREEGADKKVNESVARMDDKGAPNQSAGTWRKREAKYLDREVQGRTEYNSAQKSDDASVGFSSGPSNAKLDAASKNVGQSTVRGLWEFQGSRPCVAGGRLFLTQGDQVVALDPDSGKEIWSRDLAGDLEKVGGHLGAPPSPAGDKLYLATVSGDLIILSQARGEVLETIHLDAPMRFQPSLAKGRLYIGATNGDLISLDLADPSADGWTMWGGGPTHNGK